MSNSLVKIHNVSVEDASFYTESDLKQQQANASAGFICAVIASWLLSSFFIASFFAGGDIARADSWTAMQWIYAGLGVLLATALTYAEALLFRSGRMKESLLVAVASITFAVYCEVAATMQREQMAVKHASTQSEVFKTTLATARNLGQVQTTGTQQSLARVYAQIENAKQNDKYNHVKTLQHRAKQLEQLIAIEQQNQAALLSQTLVSARELEYDEKNHQAIIKLMSELFGISHVLASGLFAFFLIGTFKLASHYMGNVKQRTRRAIDIKMGTISATLVDSLNPDYTALPRSDGNSANVDRSHDPDHVNMHVDMDGTTEKQQHIFESNENVKAGTTVNCPWCFSEFEKKTYNQRFCKSTCRDDWHNAKKPERLQHKGK